MLDFLLFVLFAIVFLSGVQVGAWFGGIPQWIRWIADQLEEKFKKANPKNKDHE